MNDPRPSFWQRLSDQLLIRRADQTVIAVLILAGIVLVALWWWRNGGADGTLVDHDRLPQLEAVFIVDVNTAGVAELSELPGIGPALAERIVDYRRKHGPFAEPKDLLNVKGIGDRTLEQLRPHLSFGGVRQGDDR